MPSEIILQIDTCEIEREDDGALSWLLDHESRYRTYEELISGVSIIFKKIIRKTKADGNVEIKTKYRADNPIKNLIIVIESDTQSVTSELVKSFRDIMMQVRDVFDLASEITNDGLDPANIRIVGNDVNTIQAINNEISAPKWCAAIANKIRKSTYNKNSSFVKITIKLDNEDIIYSIPHGEIRYIGDEFTKNIGCTVNCVNDKQFHAQIITNHESPTLSISHEHRDVLLQAQANNLHVDIKWRPNHKLTDGNDKIINGTLVDVALTPHLDFNGEN